MSTAVELVTEDVEVSAKARRRRFTAEYKQEILRRADACSKQGEMGTLLRAEGLYASHVLTWRRQRTSGEIAGLTPKKRGRKAVVIDARDRENAELRRQVSRLTARAERAEGLVEVQKKLAILLGTPFESDKP